MSVLRDVSSYLSVGHIQETNHIFDHAYTTVIQIYVFLLPNFYSYIWIIKNNKHVLWTQL